jgi:hypothetical protein
MTKWHYVAVRKRSGGEIWLELHELFLDQAGRIQFRTEDPIVPRGTDVDDLVVGIRHALCDVVRWGAVDEAELRPGVRLTPRREIPTDASAVELVKALRSVARTRNLRETLLERLQERQVRRARIGAPFGRRVPMIRRFQP